MDAINELGKKVQNKVCMEAVTVSRNIIMTCRRFPAS